MKLQVFATFVFLTTVQSKGITENPDHPYAVRDTIQPVVQLTAPVTRLTSGLCTNVYTKLCDGCTDLLTCLGKAEPDLIENCANTKKPFCLNGACSIHPPSAACAAAQPAHICTGAGYYPHPTDCQRYVLCADKGGESKIYDCPTSYVYNAATEQCMFQWWPTDCRQIVCPLDGIDQYVAYPGNPGLYALCASGKPIMFRCDDPANFQFNAIHGRCELKCQRPGRVADPGDCNAYYECSLSQWPQFQSAHWTCVQGYGYSVTAQKCVRGVCDTENPTVPPEEEP